MQVISKIFRGIFVKLLRQAYQSGELTLKGAIADLSNPKEFSKLLDQLMKKEWCVYAKKPFNGAKGAVDYLAKYVYKTAISNGRILSCDDGKVNFSWRDYSDHNKIKTMSLDPNEFIRRFLSHVLPTGFMRIRSFGFLASACKAKKISKIFSILNEDVENFCSRKKESTEELMRRLTGIDISFCQKCKIGKLQTIDMIPNFKQLKSKKYQDTS